MSAPVRFSPRPPTCVVNSRMSMDGSLLNLKQEHIINWAASSEFGTYRLCEQRRFRRACASAQSHQNLRCSLISSESRRTFRQKARFLAPLNGWACAVKICHDGMLEDTNSLDAAQFIAVLLQQFTDSNFVFSFPTKTIHLPTVTLNTGTGVQGENQQTSAISSH